MRLEELFLDGFGHFHQRTFDASGGPVTVFYGPNEAGKSTLLAFVRTVLFGFPARGQNSHYPPLSGGRHGGRIRLSGDDGQGYTVERYAGARGGQLAVRDDTGESLAPVDFLRRITGQATQDVFSNVFAFGIDELQQVGLLDAPSVSEAIYSAGQGVPALSAFSQSLATRSNALFQVRGRVQEVPKLANALRDIDAQLRSVEGNAGRYGSLTSRRTRIDAQLRDIDVERSQWNARQTEVGNLITGWDDWLQLGNCDSRLEVLPSYDTFPENATPRLDGFEERLRQSRSDAEDAAEQLRVAADTADAVVVDAGLLEASDRIEEIRRGRGSFDGSVHDLPERQSELREMEANVARSLADLGHQWGEAELEAFDASLLVRNQVDHWKQRMTESGERLRQAESRLDQERQRLLDLQLETQAAREQLPPEPPLLDAGALLERSDALRAARGRLDEYERQRQNQENLRGQLTVLTAGAGSRQDPAAKPNPIALILLALAAAAMVGTGLLLGGGALPMGLIAGAILVGAALAFWFIGRPGPSAAPAPVTSTLGQQAADADAGLERARQALLAAAATLGLQGQPDAAALDSSEVRLDASRTQLDAWTSANTRLEEAARRERSQQQRLERAAADQAAAEESERETQQEWRQWLRTRQLDEALTPDTMTTFIARVETARGLLTETRRMRDRVSAIERDIAEFQEQVQPLAVAHAIPLTPNDWAQTASAADALINRMDHARDDLSRQKAAIEQRDEAARLVERQDQRLKSVRQELQAFLAFGETDNPESFRVRARQHEERLELERQRGELTRGLERLSGPGEDFNALRECLTATTLAQLNEESGRVSEKSSEIEEVRSGLLEERGRIENELEQLTGEEESSRLRVRRNTLLEQLNDRAREWSRLTLAEALLERTRHKFETERQPRVVQHAQDFFSHITGQRYDRLFVPIGERAVTVRDRTGSSKRPQELSRGTREQLYLALRFGLVREFGEHAEPLPVVVDEALVNFDPERARKTAESFAALSETNQVLIFTCHPATAEMFVGAAGARVITV